MSRYKVTYEDYTQIYGGSVIAAASWIRAYNQAEAMVSAMTFGRIRTEVLPEDVRELVILAVCAAAEGIFQAGVSANISSENNDGYSVTYRAPDTVQTETWKTVTSYLADTGLLYRGV